MLLTIKNAIISFFEPIILLLSYNPNEPLEAEVEGGEVK